MRQIQERYGHENQKSKIILFFFLLHLLHYIRLVPSESKFICLLYIFYNFFPWQYINIYRQPIRGHIRVHILNRPIKNEPTKILGIKTEYTSRAISQYI